MRIVAILAVAGLVALVVALLTGSTWAALAVIALAGSGIVLLVRDWRRERAAPADPGLPGGDESDVAGGGLRPDEFAPDISAEPGGPSSDARADQR